jgi:hypothetical protein
MNCPKCEYGFLCQDCVDEMLKKRLVFKPAADYTGLLRQVRALNTLMVSMERSRSLEVKGNRRHVQELKDKELDHLRDLVETLTNEIEELHDVIAELKYEIKVLS